MKNFIILISLILCLSISPIQQRSVRDLTLQQLLPDKIPNFAYKWVKQLLGGVSNGFSFTLSEVQNECMDQEFRDLMNESYYYWIKAPQETQSQKFDGIQSLETSTRSKKYVFIEHIKEKLGLSSRSQMPLLLLGGQLINDCQWSEIMQQLVEFYPKIQSSLKWEVGWRLAAMIPLVILELPLITAGVLFSFSELGYLIGANLKIMISL